MSAHKAGDTVQPLARDEGDVDMHIAEQAWEAIHSATALLAQQQGAFGERAATVLTNWLNKGSAAGMVGILPNLLESKSSILRRGGVAIVGFAEGRSYVDDLATIACHDPDPRARVLAVWAIGHAGNETHLPFLLELGQDVDVEMRMCANYATDMICDQPQAVRYRWVRYLTKGCEWEIREAIRELPRKELERILEAKNETERRAAEEARIVAEQAAEEARRAAESERFKATVIWRFERSLCIMCGHPLGSSDKAQHRRVHDQCEEFSV